MTVVLWLHSSLSNVSHPSLNANSSVIHTNLQDPPGRKSSGSVIPLLPPAHSATAAEPVLLHLTCTHMPCGCGIVHSIKAVRLLKAVRLSKAVQGCMSFPRAVRLFKVLCSLQVQVPPTSGGAWALHAPECCTLCRLSVMNTVAVAQHCSSSSQASTREFGAVRFKVCAAVITSPCTLPPLNPPADTCATQCVCQRYWQARRLAALHVWVMGSSSRDAIDTHTHC